MFLPPEFVKFEPVLIAAAIVFVVDLIGNLLSFSNRILNALVTALVFTAIFGGLVYANIVKIEGSVKADIPAALTPAPTPPTP